MLATRASVVRRSGPVLGLAACALALLAGCGQRGPLYMPDRNARVVTRPASAPDSSAAASAPSSAPR